VEHRRLAAPRWTQLVITAVEYQINVVPVRNDAREFDRDLDAFFDGKSIRPRSAIRELDSF